MVESQGGDGTAQDTPIELHGETCVVRDAKREDQTQREQVEAKKKKQKDWQPLGEFQEISCSVDQQPPTGTGEREEEVG